MNFKRIMLIFLVAFALLDVFLFVMVVVNVRFTNIGRQMSQSDIVMKEMRNESISFNGNLAKDNHSGYYYSLSKTNDTNSLESQTGRLHGQSTRIENGILSSSFNHPIKVDMVTKTNDFSRIIDNPKRVLSEYSITTMQICHLSTTWFTLNNWVVDRWWAKMGGLLSGLTSMAKLSAIPRVI